MSEKVSVTIPVSPEVAEALRDPELLSKASALLGVLIPPARGRDPLREAMDEMARQWQAAGMTDADLEEELAAHKRERRF